jgi:hypothetical protein
MAQKIQWDETTKRLFETGVDHVVLYKMDAATGTYPAGVPWNGITGITESPSGAEASPQYADNTVYLNMVSLEKYGGTIEAFTYPDEFAECDGSAEPVDGVIFGQQSRKPFGIAYRTVVGNDAEGNDYGYKLHLVYGCQAAPSEKSHATINDSPEAVALSWTITSTPVAVASYKPVSSITIDSKRVDGTKLAALEVILYGVTGTPGTEGRLPLPAEVITLMTVTP